MMTQHTPTPWHVGQIAADEPFEIRAEPETGVIVARTVKWGDMADGSDPARANAEHIVRCVNAHDELVAALRLIASSVRSDEQGEYCAGIARSSLAKVQQ